MSENDNFNYDNIDDMIELIYNFVYKGRKNIEKDYVYEKVNIENIDMSRIIKQGEFDYNKILMNNFNDKKNFKLILEDNHKIILKKYLNSRFPITLIIQKYDNKYRNSSSFIDITYGLFINYILSEFVILNDIPFYLINMCNFNVLYETLELNNELLSFINKNFKENKTDDKYCISVYENYRSYISMKEFLDNEKTFEELVCLVFQVLYSYYYIINSLGNFRMNYFTINSFIIEKLNEEKEIILNIGNIKFMLRTKFICKLCDFRYSTLETVKNLKNKDELLDNPSNDNYIDGYHLSPKVWPLFKEKFLEFTNLEDNEISINYDSYKDLEYWNGILPEWEDVNKKHIYVAGGGIFSLVMGMIYNMKWLEGVRETAGENIKNLFFQQNKEWTYDKKKKEYIKEF